MRTLLTIFAVLVLLAALVLVGIYSGAYDVAADQPEGGLTHWLLETTQERSVSAAASGLEPPTLSDTARIEAGAHHFRGMCETCHGAPGVEPSEIGQGLNPKPPELSHAAREWDSGEIFWMVKHGIKMTGMPAFGATHSDEEIWSIVAFVEQLPEMSAAEYRAQAGASGGESGGHEHAGASRPDGGAAPDDGHPHPAGGHDDEPGAGPADGSRR